MTLDDDGLRRRFDELRSADRLRAPAFDAVLTGPRGAARRSYRVRPLMLAAAAIVVTAGVWRGMRDASVLAAPPIVAWRPATDMLLPTTASALLGEMPPLRSSVLDSILGPLPTGDLIP